MKCSLQWVLVVWAVIAVALPAGAQVEKASIQTSGISCGVCALVSEARLRGVDGVRDIDISLSTQMVTVYYGHDGRFQPGEIRQILDLVRADILSFSVTARGRVRDEDGQRYLLAGSERFLLKGSDSVRSLPSGVQLVIEATLDDKLMPPELEVTSFRRIDR